MRESHLINAIKKLKRDKDTKSYTYHMLCAERTFRDMEKKQDAEVERGQLQLDVEFSLNVDCEPPPPEPKTKPYKVYGGVVRRGGLRGLERMLRHIGAKHETFFNEYDEDDEY